MSEDAVRVEIPDFVVRQIGTLQLQLAAANEEIARLNEALAAAQAESVTSRDL